MSVVEERDFEEELAGESSMHVQLRYFQRFLRDHDFIYEDRRIDGHVGGPWGTLRPMTPERTFAQ